MTKDVVIRSDRLSDLGLEGGINESTMRIVQVESGLFTPRQGLSDTRAMTKAVSKGEALAELARYEFDQVLGHDTVPDVVEYVDERVRPDLESFMMRWVDDAGFGGDAVGRLGWDERFSPSQLRDFARITVLDSITGNTDRHSYNYLVDRENDKVWAIDSGFGEMRSPGGLGALKLLGLNVSGIRYNYDTEVVRQELASAAAEVRAKLPALKEIAARRLGPDAARNLESGLGHFEQAVTPVRWPAVVSEW